MFRKNISESKKGKSPPPFSKEHIKNISEAKKGEKN
jgi:hypothetical protein